MLDVHLFKLIHANFLYQAEKAKSNECNEREQKTSNWYKHVSTLATEVIQNGNPHRKAEAYYLEGLCEISKGVVLKKNEKLMDNLVITCFTQAIGCLQGS